MLKEKAKEVKMVHHINFDFQAIEMGPPLIFEIIYYLANLVMVE